MHAPCPTVCNPMDFSSPGSSAHGIVQARILEWFACPDPGIELVSLTCPALAGRFFYPGSPKCRKHPELPSAKGHHSRRDTVHAG